MLALTAATLGIVPHASAFRQDLAPTVVPPAAICSLLLTLRFKRKIFLYFDEYIEFTIIACCFNPCMNIIEPASHSSSSSSLGRNIDGFFHLTFKIVY